MENLPNNYPATPEGVWAGFQETRLIMQKSSDDFEKLKKENFDGFKELRQLMKENELKAEKARAEAEKARERERIASEKRIKKIEDLLGSWANNFGSFAEEYFFNSFENEQQNFFGEHFNKIRKNLKMSWKNIEDEYDIVMYNDHSVAIVEVKSKAHENDVKKVIKKAETFKILCPDYSTYNIYLGLASLSFYPELEQECIEHGIAIVKQVGDTVVINDKHLKKY